MKTVSSLELSVQERLICDDETALATKLLGAFGAPEGVGVGVGVGVAVGVAVGVGVGVGAPPQPGNLNEAIRVRQLKLVVVA